MKTYKDDNECLHNDSKHPIDGGTQLIGYLMIAIMLIIFSLITWFGTKWLTSL